MSHYICTGGCNGVSDTPGTCGAATCPLHGHPLVECNCEDGLHGKTADETTHVVEEQTPEENSSTDAE